MEIYLVTVKVEFTYNNEEMSATLKRAFTELSDAEKYMVKVNMQEISAQEILKEALKDHYCGSFHAKFVYVYQWEKVRLN